jgi:hypothetical protein
VALYNRPQEYSSAAVAFDQFSLDHNYVCWNREFLRAMGREVATRGYVNVHGASFFLNLAIHGSSRTPWPARRVARAAAIRSRKRGSVSSR